MLKRLRRIVPWLNRIDVLTEALAAEQQAAVDQFNRAEDAEAEVKKLRQLLRDLVDAVEFRHEFWHEYDGKYPDINASVFSRRALLARIDTALNTACLTRTEDNKNGQTPG